MELKNILSVTDLGIPSLCSSSELVIEAALEYSRANDVPVLIESTANQVNQYGGYTGMTPADFFGYVHSLAERIGAKKENIILGGDHLGPVVFKHLPEAQAMREAEELISEYVKAGFSKIHIDTSMRLADDDARSPLTDETIARRGALLCKAAEDAYDKAFGRPSRLVYVIGSEVPVPGGTQSGAEELKVTSPEDFANTYEAFRSAFAKAGLGEAFKRVIAVVVQPGVEFGDDSVDEYCSANAKDLTSALKKYSGLVFEGHSTDYQTETALRNMILDGIKVLKVGPELTFALREGLFALQMIERELSASTDFINVLDSVMVQSPENWEKYYSGTTEEKAFKRKYSYSDRWRYYSNEPRVQQEIDKLFASLDAVDIPLNIISQYLPVQYEGIRSGRLEPKAKAMAKDKIREIISKYYSAAFPK